MIGGTLSQTMSVYANCGLGSTGHWPVPSGDSPDGMGRASPANEDSLILGAALLVPVGGSPTGTGGSPVPPIFQIRSKSKRGWTRGQIARHAGKARRLGAEAPSRVAC